MLARGLRPLLQPRVLLGAAACVLLAILQYGYLFWRTADPDTPYVENPVASLGELWTMISDERYQRSMFIFAQAFT